MEFLQEEGRVYALSPNGKLLCEIFFPLKKEGLCEIDRTFVDPSLAGQGVASRLVEAAAKQIAARGLKADVNCSYAQRWFSSHPQYNALLNR